MIIIHSFRMRIVRWVISMLSVVRILMIKVQLVGFMVHKVKATKKKKIILLVLLLLDHQSLVVLVVI